MKLEAEGVPVGGDDVVRVVIARAGIKIAHNDPQMGELQPDIVFDYNAHVLELDPREDEGVCAL